MIFRQLFDQASWTYTYLLADPDTREAVLIDPVVEQADRDFQLLNELDLTLLYTLDTHVHADHVTGAGKLRERTGAKTVVSAAANVPCVDWPVKNRDRIRFGRHEIEVRSTPGHTNGCVSYVVRDGERTLAFTGDALFVRGCGRTDFQQGDPHTLYHSVHEQLFSLPDDTVIYPAHDYRGHTCTTVAEEKAYNPRLATSVSEERFVDIMNGLKLADPRLMDVAVPANLACGITPVGTRSFHEKGPRAVGDLANYQVIDVREPEEWDGEHGHLEGAELVPLGSLPERAASWPKDKPLLMVCRSGRRSADAAARLVSMGFHDVTNLAGGMIAWNAVRGASK